MFEVGWSELLVIAVVMIVVVGPKDLPSMLRTFGRTAAKLRAMAADFQKQFNDALKEAELDDVKSSIDSLRSLNPMTEVRKQLNPFEQAAADVRAGVDTMMKPKPADPAASELQAAEPLKNGATEMPGVTRTEAAPAAPVFPAMTDASVTASAVETAVPAQPAKKAATSKAKAPGAAAKTAASKAPAVKASAKPSAASARAAAPAKKLTPKAEAKPAAAKKPATKKAADTKKTAGAAK
ncbi:twin-arginine translocase subunit TatB [Mesorhizobium sp. M1C.F.Ca.ET.193.01.1.1]|uniref:Sec-independent protein translocase protein TatB n=1 Tax=unclassified Mesorhizobium TaxID=325217 RepID=UPI000FD3B921|nr:MULTISPECIES: Sec-independent protein translocase protein TatB [unclassified Mesorhizobium]TGT01380.1 twin-arginine translocase subunit TatB [bacterium M00.F.Ca.ET.177.01.1.1]TGQ54140.1 twin-arginine translocase subunit TatB [Mesorhizobium sp. M1C.F.Ca.ET.210.01.1.1]TGQ72154.1 twin-arginine translocase subunit TatB [Mesorhizobium sp. M1C.F.Ca.ET.212.01.1.1]TGR09969.1 twin-arginine translocase subunit TatB [Mesorhizobium sp. M1C.F.Ca.ET.204.01.1.1]TGR30089.1 twin-arginine translocase subunit